MVSFGLLRIPDHRRADKIKSQSVRRNGFLYGRAVRHKKLFRILLFYFLEKTFQCFSARSFSSRRVQRDDVHSGFHQLVHFLHRRCDIHCAVGIVSLHDTDNRQIHFLLNLRDIFFRVRPNASGSRHLRRSRHSSHNKGRMKRFLRKRLTRHNQLSV